MRKTTTLFAIAAIVLAACGSGGAQEYGGAPKSEAAGMVASDSAPTAPTEQKPAPSMPRKIIYKGSIELATENLDAAAAKLEAKTKEFGGYIGDANKTGDKGSTREAFWTIRIPSDKFDPFVQFVSTLGELHSNRREAQDVSEEFYDVQARLKNKRIEEARLVELLKKSTGKLSEILTVEKEISRVREECEQIEGRLRFLANQTDLSTISVTIREVKNFQPETTPTVQTQVSRTFNGSIDAMKQLGLAILLMAVAIAPWLVPFAIIVWILFRIARKATPKPTTAPPSTMPFDTGNTDQK